MDPDQFRETRLKINGLNEAIRISAENKDKKTADTKFTQATDLLEELGTQAEGEIQQRSVQNLKNKLKFSSGLIEKIKTAKKTSSASGAFEKIIWDEERLSHLSGPFLSKLFENMGTNPDAQVCLSTSGKGIKPSYQVEFGNGETIAFSGSTHKKLKRKLSRDPDKTSPPFSVSTIREILDKQN